MDSNIASYHPSQIRLTLPLFLGRVPAGFPSPAADYIQKHLSTDDLLIHDSTATYFVRAQGDSMVDAGIFDGNVLVVDTSRTVQPGDIVVAYIDGGFTVKRLHKAETGFELHPENAAAGYPIIRPSEELRIYGVVVAHLHLHHKKPGLGL